MKAVRWVVVPSLCLAALAGGLVLLVNGLAEPADAWSPDPAMLITLPDGGQRPLGDLLAAADRVTRADADAPAPGAPERLLDFADEGFGFRPHVGAGLVEPAGAGAHGAADHKRALIVPPRDIGEPAPFVRESWRDAPDPDDPYELAEYHLWTTGEVEQAYALFRSVPADHPHYNVAQRRIGWEILTKERGDPRQGVAYINRSMTADPFDHDIWQDTWRVYMRTLGMEVP